MSLFSYNYFKNLKRPEVYLAYPNKSYIGSIHTFDLQTDIMANSADKGSFKIYRYEDNKPTKHYNMTVLGMYIHIYGIGWFKIKELSTVNEGTNEYKEVTIISLEYELGQTYLTSFGSLGVNDDEQGGLDRYCLYNPLDVTHSIMHIVIEKNPAWSIKYIDLLISTEYRSFNIDSIDTYSFLTSNVSETYECIFLFDGYDRSISAYKLESLGTDNGIILNYRNVIKNIKMDSDDGNVKTVLTVIGGNDERTNTPLGIIDVNISGTNQIYNFNYFLSMMSTELQGGLKKYNELCTANAESYQTKLSALLSLYDERNTLKNKVPDDENSLDWIQFGLRELQEKEIIYKTNMSLFLKEPESESYKKNFAIHAAIEAEIIVRNQQISDKEAEIKTLLSEVSKLVVDIKTVLGESLYQELSLYIKEDTLTDDSFVSTNTMKDSEILEMQKSLLAHGDSELSKICYPQFTMDVDLINFTVDYDYKRFTDAMDMFNIIYINFEEHDSMIGARLLKLHINWDDPSDFKSTFSNRNSLGETWALLEELRNQTETISTQVGFGSGAWKGAAQSTIDLRGYLNNVLNASKQQLVTNDNNEVKIDATGILCRKWLPEQQIYDPGQIWITNNQVAISKDGFNSVGIAIGYVKVGNDYFFGVAADSLVGRILISEQVFISNASGSYTIDKNGFVAKNGIYQVKINPDTPTDIFSILIDSKKLLYVDTINKKLKFEGDVESTSGHIASFTISGNSLTSGTVGLCSDTLAGTVAFWAGNANKIIAPFRVTNQGDLICSNIDVTGGKMNFANGIFVVNSDGSIVAKNGTFTGTVNALSGYIGGWRIENRNLIAESPDSQIKSGQFWGDVIGVGALYADSKTVGIGSFGVFDNKRTNQFSAENDSVGMNADASDSSEVSLWASNMAFAVNGNGETHCDLLFAGRYNVGNEISDLWDAIHNIDTGA